MYYYISGDLVQTGPGYAVIDNRGIGYKASVSAKTLGKLAAADPKNVKLYTCLITREDSSELYGFYDVEECQTFQMLITVSGVGPKAAVSILSELSPERFALCVISNDYKSISAAQGVGVKTAQKIVLELQDKIKKTSPQKSASGVCAVASPASSDDFQAAVDALAVLGYTRKEAYDSLEGVDPSESVENMIKAGLKKLMR